MVQLKAILICLIFAMNSALVYAQGKGTQNPDLFPNLPTSPSSGGSSDGPITIDETDDTTDSDDNGNSGFNNGPGVIFQPNPGFNRGGGSSGSRNDNMTSNEPAITNNTIRAAVVPGQYSCPLFENNSYQDLNLAIGNLTNAIQNVSDECRSSQPKIENVKQTNDQVRAAIAALQGYVQNPETGYEKTAELQSNVNNLVTGIDRLADVFKNTTSLSNACGRRVSSWGRVALELNNVVNSASPFLLLLLAANPALSLTVKSTIMGTVVATNVISALSDVISSNTVDMTVPDQRNAVLQNTCQFTKVARKIRYIQLAQSGQFKQLEKELKENLSTLTTQMVGENPEMFGVVDMRNNIRTNIGSVQANTRADREAFDEINQRVRENTQGNALLICYEGQQLAQTTDESSFPNSVIQSIFNAYDQKNYLKNIDLNNYDYSFGYRKNSQDESDKKLKTKVLSLISNYQKLMVRLANYPKEPKGSEIAECAATTMAFLQHINRMINETTKIMVDDLDKFEEELAQNEDYRKWKAQFDRVTVEQENTNRMARVLRELTNAGAAVYNRSEFNEAANALKRSLLGPRTGGLFGLLQGKSPVFAWLYYKQGQYIRAIGSFDKSMTTIESKAYSLVNSHSGSYPRGLSTYQANQKILNDLEMAATLKILNRNTLPLNSAQWEYACIDLEKAVKDYAEALDHLGTTNFMCDLIFEHLDNSADPEIIKYCRGQTDYSGVQTKNQRSALDRATLKLSQKAGPRLMSYREKSEMVAKKMIEIGCRLPRAAESN